MEMNGEDFSQDVQTNEESMNGNENGAGDKAANGGGDNNGSAEAPGRDDDRYVVEKICICMYAGWRILCGRSSSQIRAQSVSGRCPVDGN